MTNVATILDETIQTRPDAMALLRLADANGELQGVSYADLDTMVANFAGGIARRGVGAGDSVVVFVPISLELYVVMLAVMRIGAVAVFIDPWAGKVVLEGAAAMMRPKAFVGIPKAHLLRLRSRTLRKVALPITVDVNHGGGSALASIAARAKAYSRILAEGAREPIHESVEVADDAGALVTFTTGSTGAPKGADRTHGLLLAQHEALRAHVDHTPSDVHLTNLPIVVLHNLACGVPTLLPPPALAQDPKVAGGALRTIVEDGGATVLGLSPEPLAALVRSEGTPFARVRAIATGGGPVLPELAEAAGLVFPSAQIDVLYGSTEAEPIAHASADAVAASRAAMREHGGIFVGMPVAETRVAIVPPVDGPWRLPDGRSVESFDVGEGIAGEVLVAGAHVNRSYIANPQAVAENKTIDADGTVWHRTGDIARRTASGELWLLGRASTALQRAADDPLYALELETPVTDHPAVRRAAVASRPGGWILAVEPADATQTDAAIGHARSVLERRARTDVDVRALTEIPVDKRHATKIDLVALDAALEEGERR